MRPPTKYSRGSVKFPGIIAASGGKNVYTISIRRRTLLMRRCAFRIPRWIPVLFLTGGFLGVGGLQPQSRDSSVSPERAVVNRYCISCHNSALKAGDLALDEISGQDVSRHPDVWEKVVRKLRAR